MYKIELGREVSGRVLVWMYEALGSISIKVNNDDDDKPETEFVE